MRQASGKHANRAQIHRTNEDGPHPQGEIGELSRRCREGPPPANGQPEGRPCAAELTTQNRRSKEVISNFVVVQTRHLSGSQSLIHGVSVLDGEGFDYGCGRGTATDCSRDFTLGANSSAPVHSAAPPAPIGPGCIHPIRFTLCTARCSGGPAIVSRWVNRSYSTQRGHDLDTAGRPNHYAQQHHQH